MGGGIHVGVVGYMQGGGLHRMVGWSSRELRPNYWIVIKILVHFAHKSLISVVLLYCILRQDPFISATQTPGTYPPFDRGQALGAWVTQADGSTPAVSSVRFVFVFNNIYIVLYIYIYIL